MIYYLYDAGVEALKEELMVSDPYLDEYEAQTKAHYLFEQEYLAAYNEGYDDGYEDCYKDVIDDDDDEEPEYDY